MPLLTCCTKEKVLRRKEKGFESNRWAIEIKNFPEVATLEHTVRQIADSRWRVSSRGPQKFEDVVQRPAQPPKWFWTHARAVPFSKSKQISARVSATLQSEERRLTQRESRPVQNVTFECNFCYFFWFWPDRREAWVTVKLYAFFILHPQTQWWKTPACLQALF